MRIGIDATTWWNRRGFGRFTRHLLQAMFRQGGHEFILFVDHEPAAAMQGANVRVVKVGTSAPVTEAAVADGSRSVADLLRFGRSVGRERPDVMYFPAVYSWFPTPPGIPTVVTFHDAIAEHFTALVLPDRRGRIMWRAKTWLAKRTARAVTTVSQAAAAEIDEYLGIPRSRMTVIHEAADDHFAPVENPATRRDLRRRLNLPDDRRYILYVGGIAPHKNLEKLVRGFVQVCAIDGVRDLDLVITGDPAGSGFLSSFDALVRYTRQDDVAASRIHFTGFVADADLPALFSDALVTAMPAFSEGFGLPALESIACGTPVIATGGGAVEEIVGDAGVYFDPRDCGSIAAAITAVATDRPLLDRLRSRCVARSASFSWDRAAQATIAVLERAGRAA